MATHITIPMARLIELETAEHERDILRADKAQLAREAHTWWTACRDATQELERVRAEASALRALWNEAEAENNNLKGVAHG
jgi:hypothetical protein